MSQPSADAPPTIGATLKAAYDSAASRQWTPFARVAGVALLALGLACWPGTNVTGERTPATHAMLAYNPLIASYLVYLAAVGVAGILLWPAVAEHVIVTLLLLLAWRAAGSSSS